jgi:Tfp pilus assembly protein PilE
MIYKNIQKNKGYTLLFAVMVSSLVLAVGISILNISKKEFLLSSSARESITAFYAADSALECAVYHDNEGKFSFAKDLGSVKCVGNIIKNISDVSTGANSTISYEVSLKPNSENSTMTTCAKVVRTYDSTTKVVEFVSRGYNMGWNSTGNTCSDPSPRRVERALHYTYSLGV